MLKVALVYRSGGPYGHEDVERLSDQIQAYMGLKPVVFTDLPLPYERHILLMNDWPHWWSKIELFNPYHRHDWLYMDLDTMIVEDISDLLSLVCNRPIILEDFYRPGGYQSSFMYIPHHTKQVVWDRFNKNPAGWMREFEAGGDQEFIQAVGWRGQEVHRWQDLYPGRFVSYKVHVLPNGNKVPKAADVVIFHGQPKPRDIKWTLDLEQ